MQKAGLDGGQVKGWGWPEWVVGPTCGEYFKSTTHLDGGTAEFLIVSRSIAWIGTCEQGRCRPCYEAQTRCESGAGIPQICRNGKVRLNQKATLVLYWVLAVNGSETAKKSSPGEQGRKIRHFCYLKGSSGDAIEKFY